MPVKAVLRNNRFRVVDSNTGRITMNKAGTSVDGGGNMLKSAVDSQVRAINASLKRRGEI